MLPALLLPAEACKRILRTKAIAVYDHDVTCLLTVRSDNITKVRSADHASGVMVYEHKKKSDRESEVKPKWLMRPKDATPEEHWNLAVTTAKAANGAVAYRAGGGSCLGAFGKVAQEAALPPGVGPSQVRQSIGFGLMYLHGQRPEVSQ